MFCPMRYILLFLCHVLTYNILWADIMEEATANDLMNAGIYDQAIAIYQKFLDTLSLEETSTCTIRYRLASCFFLSRAYDQVIPLLHTNRGGVDTPSYR